MLARRSGRATPLRQAKAGATFWAMISRAQWRWFIDHPVVEWTMFVIGVLLLIVSPLVGAIPGPGGVVVAGVGLALILKTSMWARRHYVKFKRWKPKAGRWTDWALRRRSHLRRERLRRERERAEAAEALEGGAVPAAIGQAPPQPAGAAPIDTPPESASDPKRPAD